MGAHGSSGTGGGGRRSQWSSQGQCPRVAHGGHSSLRGGGAGPRPLLAWLRLLCLSLHLALGHGVVWGRLLTTAVSLIDVTPGCKPGTRAVQTGLWLCGPEPALWVSDGWIARCCCHRRCRPSRNVCPSRGGSPWVRSGKSGAGAVAGCERSRPRHREGRKETRWWWSGAGRRSGGLHSGLASSSPAGGSSSLAPSRGWPAGV